MTPKEILEAWQRLPPDVQAQLKAVAKSKGGDQEAMLQMLIKQYLLSRTPAGVVVNAMSAVEGVDIKKTARIAGRWTGKLLRRLRED